MISSDKETLVSLLLNAIKSDSKITFIDGPSEESVLTYNDLYQVALYVLHNMKTKGIKEGDEVIFYISSNREFLILFWACLLGKVIPVPLSSGDQNDIKLKLIKIWKKLKNPFLITERHYADKLVKFADEFGYQKDIETIEGKILFSDEIVTQIRQGEPSAISSDDIAYIQYSSGSTGDPKGVVLTHRNLVANTTDIIERSEIVQSDGMLSWMPLTHDMGLICFHLSGIRAGIDQSVMPPSLFMRKPMLWMEKAVEHKSTLLYSPNFGYQYFLSAFEGMRLSGDLSRIRLIYNGAEPISTEVIDRFVDRLSPFGLKSNVMFPGYGLAEASVAVTLPKVGSTVYTYFLDRTSLNIGSKIKMVDSAEQSVSFVQVGYPVSKCQLRICDLNGTILNENIVGEIQIKGENVTRGYYNDSHTTSKTITEDGWLKTGDLGFLNEDGNLVITGRCKNVIIINGQNFYPQDIERVVSRIEGIGQVVACGFKTDENSPERLILFVLFKGTINSFVPFLPKIQEQVLKGIGVFVDKIIPVKKIPKTTSGKVQNYKLIEKFNQGDFEDTIAVIEKCISEANHIALSHQVGTEEKLLHIINNLIESAEIKIESNLFEVGINSLMASQLVSRINHAFKVDISVKQIFDYPSIKALSLFIKDISASANYESIVPILPELHYPLSSIQKRFWMLGELSENSNAYNINFRLRIEGALSVDAFVKSFHTIIDRHEILRTSFVNFNGELKQVVGGHLINKLNFIDCRKGAHGNESIDRILEREANTLFDLNQGVLFRASLFQVEAELFMFNFTVHHIIFDGWSAKLFVNELGLLYDACASATENPLPALHLQYRDCQAWVKRQLVKQRAVHSTSYWKNEFKDGIQNLKLPSDRVGLVSGSVKSESINFTLSNITRNQLNAIGKENGVTLFITVMSMLNVLFYKYSGETDIVLGTDTAGRTHQDLENQIGCYINTLPIRTSFDGGDNFKTVLEKVTQKILLAFEHQHFDYDGLIEELNNKSYLNFSSLFNVLVILQNFDPNNKGFTNLSVSNSYGNINSTLIDLHLEFIENPDSLSLNVRFNSELFSYGQIERMVEHFELVVIQIQKNPSIEISKHVIITENEISLIETFNTTSLFEVSTKSIVELFEEQVRHTPESIAVEFENRRFSFSELNDSADKVANFLTTFCGVKLEDRVGLLLERSERVVTSMLGVLKAGAAYIALDPDFPIHRLNYLIHDSDIKILITDIEHLPEGLIGSVKTINIATIEKTNYPIRSSFPNYTERNLAYINYTSGSSGEPKGVVVEHKSLLNYVLFFKNYFNISAKDVVIQQASVSFDTIVEEVYPVLLAGGKVLISKEGGRNIESLINDIENKGVTVLSTTPAVIKFINDAGIKLESLRMIISGGDRIRVSDIDKLIGKVDLFNTYGPTETTVCATFGKIEALKNVSNIGRPIANNRIYLVDNNFKQSPIGVEGEICISGLGLARGYLNNVPLTDQKFVVNHFEKGDNLYRTGDLGKWQSDGSIVFVGRIDKQVKINGYRIEPGEIENTLLKIGKLSEVVVATKPGMHGEVYLVAYYRAISSIEEGTLRAWCIKYLPLHLIPAYFLEVSIFPVTKNGKIDINSLPLPDGVSPNIKIENHTPGNYRERILSEIWKSILEKDIINITDNFFELGGNSIKATQVIHQVYKRLNSKVSLKDIFMHPTIKELIKILSLSESKLFESIPQTKKQEFYDVSHAQKRMWILDKLKENATAYNLSWAFELTGQVDENAFQSAFLQVVERHEILRTNFITVDEELKQKINNNILDSGRLKIIDLRNEGNIEYELQKILKTVVSTNFNLESSSLFRSNLILLDGSKSVFTIAMHHIVTDGWSINNIVNEFVKYYNNFKFEIKTLSTPLSIQYKDFANWQNKILQKDSIKQHKTYWKDRLSGEITPLALPIDSSRSASREFNGATVKWEFNKSKKKELEKFAAQRGVTVFMMLLGVCKVLLYKYTGQCDITVGTPVAGREHPDLEDQIGLYVNTLALRTRFNENEGFDQLLQQIKSTVIEAFEHQIYPFDKLVEELNLERDLRRNPLFDVMIGYQNIEAANQITTKLVDVSMAYYELEKHSSQFDLSIDFFDTQEALSMQLEYDTFLFSAVRIQHLIIHIQNLVDILLKEPSASLQEITYLSDKEFNQLLFEFNPPIKTISTHTFQEWFEEQAKLSEQEIALIDEYQQLTYKQLNERANQFANYLREMCGIKPNDLVGLIADRSANSIVLILGIIKSGGAYVPIDADYPEERINYIIKDSGVKILLNDSKSFRVSYSSPNLLYFQISEIESNFLSYSTSNPENHNSSSDLIYIIYTSGSSGQPKGVMVEHKNVISVSKAWRDEYKLESFKVSLLQIASISFDVFFGDLCRALLNGGKMVICSIEARLSPALLYNLIDKYRINILESTPGLILPLMEYISEQKKDVSFMKLLILGSDTCLYKDFKTLESRFGNEIRIINSYGTTETTIDSACFEQDNGFAGINTPIGKPLSNTQIYILDSLKGLVPVGVIGEMYIGGAGVSRGYTGKEELTRAKFIVNPFNSSDRLYATGDLARWLPEGIVEFIGRQDSQVKIRGYRIELGEIENTVIKYPGIKESVVIVHKDESGDQHLVCYYSGVTALDSELLGAHIQSHLPRYMVPVSYEYLSNFPLTVNGKLDRKSLPPPSFIKGGSGLYKAASNTIELELVWIWEEVLGRSGIGVRDNFFEIGGHSLKAIQVISKIHKRYDVKLDLLDFFNHPQIESQGQHIVESARNEYESIGAIERQAHYALSHSQKRLWVLAQFEQGQTAYNMPGSYLMKGDLSLVHLEQAFTTLISRHEILRTTFKVVSGDPRQHIAEEVSFKIDYEDHRGLATSQADLVEKSEAYLSQRFDLSHWPLLRSKVIHIGEGEYIFLFCIHHIISDGWSIDIIINETISLYNAYKRALPNPLPALTIQYKDYTHWMNKQLVDDRLTAHKEYWLNQFKEEIPVLEFPLDKPRPLFKSFKGSAEEIFINKETRSRLEKIGQEQGVSLFMILLSSVHVLLNKYTGQKDIVIGVPVAGRDHRELENQIGFYVNTLALRTQFSTSNTFEALLYKIREDVLAGYSHQLYPFDRLVEELGLARDLSRSALFDVMVSLQNTAIDGKGLEFMEGVNIISYPLAHKISKFDLLFNFYEDQGRLSLSLEYNTELFDSTTIKRVLRHYETLLSCVVNNPKDSLDTLDYLAPEEKTQLVKQFNNTDSFYPGDKSIEELFEEQVEKTPDALAVVSLERVLTYKELEAYSNQVANFLREEHKVSRNSSVGLMLDKSEWMLIGIFGILKAGGGYVPIDPHYPKERKQYIIEDSLLQVVLTEAKYVHDFSCTIIDIKDDRIWQKSKYRFEVEKTSDDLVYSIYTSGTTGYPKGVEITDRSVVNLSHWLSELIYKRHKEALVGMLTASISFDASVQQLFAPVLNGSSLVLLPEERKKDLGQYLKDLVGYKVDVLDLTPGYLKLLLNEIETTGIVPALKYTLVGGEPLGQETVRQYERIFGHSSKLINVYGITECTVNSTYEIAGNSRKNLSIGKPLSNTQIYILDSLKGLVPVGVIGEMYIGGAGVSRGYTGKEELTRAKFIVNPFNSSDRLYATGDLARWLPEGIVEFIGRQDSQVKIRGYRIELGEIENTVIKYPGIKESVVIVHKDESGDQHLVCYYSGVTALDSELLGAHIQSHLPRYMVPVSYEYLSNFPLTVNGKLDRKSLPPPSFIKGGSGLYKAASNTIELELVWIWEEVLGRSGIGVRDNFFEIGGHSLKAIQVISKIHKRYDVKLDLLDFFNHPQIESQGQHIVESARNEYESIGAIERQAHYALSHSQKRLWVLAQFEQGQTAYNMPGSYLMKGDLSLVHLEQAFTTLISRHEILRTTFKVVSGDPRQHIAEEVSFKIDYEDHRGLATSQADLVEKSEAYLSQRFDLSHWPLLRSKVIHIGEGEYIFLFCIHHIISDGWSIDIIINETISLYNAYKRALPNPLPALTIQYKDYTHWMNKQLVDDRLTAHKEYWLNQFKGEIPVLQLSTDYPRPKSKTYVGETIETVLDNNLTLRLKQLSKEKHASLFMVLLALVKTLCYKYTGQTDLIIGSPVAGREHANLEDQIGCYINTLPLRTRFNNKDSFDELLAKVKETSLNAYKYQLYPFDLLIEELNIPSSRNRFPLFDIAVVFIENSNVVKSVNMMDGAQVEPYKVAVNPNYLDIRIVFEDQGEKIIINFDYSPDLYTNLSIKLMLGRFIQILENVLSNPAIKITDTLSGEVGVTDDFHTTLLDQTFQFNF